MRVGSVAESLCLTTYSNLTTPSRGVCQGQNFIVNTSLTLFDTTLVRERAEGNRTPKFRKPFFHGFRRILAVLGASRALAVGSGRVRGVAGACHCTGLRHWKLAMRTRFASRAGCVRKLSGVDVETARSPACGGRMGGSGGRGKWRAACLAPTPPPQPSPARGGGGRGYGLLRERRRVFRYGTAPSPALILSLSKERGKDGMGAAAGTRNGGRHVSRRHPHPSPPPHAGEGVHDGAQARRRAQPSPARGGGGRSSCSVRRLPPKCLPGRRVSW